MAQLTHKELKESRIWIGKNPELSKKVQERLFELGFRWGEGEKTIQYTNHVSLYLDLGSLIYYSSEDTELGKIHPTEVYKEIHLWDLGLDGNGDYDKLIGSKVKIGGEGGYRDTFGQTPGATGIIVGFSNIKSPLVYQPGIESTTSVYTPYVAYAQAEHWIIDKSPEKEEKKRIKIDTKGFKIGDHIEDGLKQGTIVGFLYNSIPVISLGDDGGHNGIDTIDGNWYNEGGEAVPYMPGKSYWFANGEPKKIDPPKEKIHPNVKFRPGMRVYSKEYNAPCTVVAFTDKNGFSDNVLVEFDECGQMSYDSSTFYDDYGNEIGPDKWVKDKFQVQCQHNLEELSEKPSKWKYKIGDKVLYWHKTLCRVVGYDNNNPEIAPYYLEILDPNYRGSYRSDIHKNVVDQCGNKIPNRSGKFTWSCENSITPIQPSEYLTDSEIVAKYYGAVDPCKKEDKSNYDRVMAAGIALSMQYPPTFHGVIPFKDDDDEINLISVPKVPDLIDLDY